MHEIQEVCVVGLGAEVGTEEVIDGCFEHKRIIDGYSTYLGEPVPAWLASAGNRRIHHIV